MTLFRKVFQTQSSPASGEDIPDEAALRSAFTEAKDLSAPLLLDPFVHQEDNFVHKENENDTGQMSKENPPEGNDVLARLNEMEFEDADPSSVFLPQEEPLVAKDLLAGKRSSRVLQDAPYQSDEEIAACLDRAMAAPVPKQTEVQSDDVEAVKDSVEDLQNEDNSTVGEKVENPRRDENPSQDSTIAQFAQGQMAALETVAKHSAQEEGEPLLDLSNTGNLTSVSPQMPGQAGRRAGRVKTRLLGFNRTGDVDHDPIGQAPETTATAQYEKYPVGWLVVVAGPGVGHSFSIFTGASMIGRGEDQVIRLDFGDNSISRNNHAAIAYDEEQNKFYIGHGGKSNIIRRNARPVLSTEELNHADLIRIGETTLRFVALCGSDFQWDKAGDGYGN
ncbi:MAG: FHA domain-containing protein [Roseobacter sp.]